MALIVPHAGRHTSAKFGHDAQSSERSARALSARLPALRSEDCASRLNVNRLTRMKSEHSTAAPSLARGRLLIALAAVLWSLSGGFSKVLTEKTIFGLNDPKSSAL